jgi:hypothetical protein
MKTTNKNTQISNHSTQPSHTSKLSRIRLTLTMAATLWCGLAVAGLSTYSIAQEQTNASQATMDHPGWVQIPGELIRPDCVHEIPNGASVEVEDGQITGDVMLNGARIAHYDACPEDAVITRPRGRTQNLAHTPGTGNGWVEADQWEASLGSKDNIDFMGGNWTVPSNPSSNGALIYLFNGIEPSSENWILQPVLQYGSNGAFGGNYWVIASWMVGPNNYAFYGTPEKVHPGNSILGYTEMTGTSGNTLYWTVEAQDTTTGAYSYITVHTSGLHWTWAFAGVLEAYNVTSCSEFPASGREVFNDSTVAHGFPYYEDLSPDWYGAIYGYGGPTCHFAVVAASATLDF